MEWPKVISISTKALTEYKFIGGSWLPMAMCFSILLSIFVPYIIVLVRGTLQPFLPFVSQASGSPPQSGIFNLLMILSALLAFIGLNLLYMGIRIQKKRLDDQWVRHTASLLNKVSLISGHVGIIGMILVASYPMDFYRCSDKWLIVTIIPHLIGAFSLFFGGLSYAILITYILALLHPERKQLLGIRIFLVSLITMCAALLGYTIRDAVMDELSDGPKLKDCVVDASFVHYNMSYLVAAVCEWSLLITFVVFFMTLREEAKDFCFTMTITLKDEEDKTRYAEEKRIDGTTEINKEETLGTNNLQKPEEKMEELRQ